MQAPFLQLGVESRADWVANGVLYTPLGFLGFQALRGSQRPRLAATLALLLAILLAFAVEFSQLFFPPRTVSQNDLLAESLGSFVGIGAAFQLKPWLERWRHTWERNAAGMIGLVWQAYAAGYLLFCFFPFDFLLSSQEVVNKLASGKQGWLFVLPGDTASSWIRVLMTFVVEVVMTIPIGLAVTDRPTPHAALRRGVLIGAALGVAIEAGQLFIASGVSQGASLLSRAAGVGLGAWLRAGWQQGHINVARAWLNRHLRWLLPAYIFPLAVASGWGIHPWQGWNQAWSSLEKLHFLPFYYHYYTTEASALSSLGSVVVMYVPVAILSWARMMSVGGAVFLAVALALPLEAGKLFMMDIHPDPTNILVAGVSAWLTRRGIAQWERKLAQRTTIATLPEPCHITDLPAVQIAPGRVAGEIVLPGKSHLPWLATGGLAVLWAATTWPAYSALVLLVISAAAISTWWRPVALLAILPAAMPVFDLTPWTGRFFFDEFDLLCATCLAIGFMRERPQLFRKRLSMRNLSFLAVLMSLGLAALITWNGTVRLDANSFTNYHSPFNGLRIFKGALWAWLFVAMYRSLVAKEPAAGRLLHIGMAAGLLLTVLVVLWERVAMVSLFDLAADYRVTGPFSVMNKGGAYIECFLAVASAFVIVELATSRQRLVFRAAVILLLLAGYAILVTYSRNGYAAFASGLTIGAVAAWQTSGNRRMAALPGLMIIAVVSVLGVLAISGGYAKERLEKSVNDLQARVAHWQVALDLREENVITRVLGSGLGHFPEMHFWRSLNEPRAATYRLETQDQNKFLRLATGATLYIEQIVSPPPGQKLSLTINLRSAKTAPKLAVALCRKTMLTSSDCQSAEIQGVKTQGGWQTQYVDFDPLPAPRNALAALVPIKLSIFTPAEGEAIDIDNISLRLPGADEYLTRNGSFEQGMSHWFFATDLDPPWHIHSLPVALLFDLGWLGLAATLVMMGVAVAGGGRAMRHGRIEGIAALAGLSAFLVSGSLNTLIDEPRFLWLWLVLAWICGWHGRPESKIKTYRHA